MFLLASHADVLRASTRVPAPRTSAELKNKFLSQTKQTSAGDHMQIIGDPIGAAEVKVLECDTWPKIFALDENIGDKRWLFVYFSL